jgi:hypothetical protein
VDVVHPEESRKTEEPRRFFLTPACLNFFLFELFAFFEKGIPKEFLGNSQKNSRKMLQEFLKNSIQRIPEKFLQEFLGFGSPGKGLSRWV